jgi:3-methyl-2-oxobutanoate hydroxymethyltransferase
MSLSRIFRPCSLNVPYLLRNNSTVRKKVSAMKLLNKKRNGKRITMVTAYDFPSALHVDRAGIDVILVGDSVGMVVLGNETTQQVTMDQMLHHCKAVKRGAQR